MTANLRPELRKSGEKIYNNLSERGNLQSPVSHPQGSTESTPPVSETDARIQKINEYTNGLLIRLQKRLKDTEKFLSEIYVGMIESRALFERILKSKNVDISALDSENSLNPLRVSASSLKNVVRMDVETDEETSDEESDNKLKKRKKEKIVDLNKILDNLLNGLEDAESNLETSSLSFTFKSLNEKERELKMIFPGAPPIDLAKPEIPTLEKPFEFKAKAILQTHFSEKLNIDEIDNAMQYLFQISYHLQIAKITLKESYKKQHENFFMLLNNSMDNRVFTESSAARHLIDCRDLAEKHYRNYFFNTKITWSTAAEFNPKIKKFRNTHTGEINGIPFAIHVAQGLRPKMEDKAFVRALQVTIGSKQLPITLFAVADGHGLTGELPAVFCKIKLGIYLNKHLSAQNSEKLTERGIVQAMHNACIDLHHYLDVKHSGTTLTFCIVIDGDFKAVYTATVGDSRAISISSLGLTSLSPASLPKDPECQTEVILAGGRIGKINDDYFIAGEGNQRINITRTLGNKEIPGLRHDPWITKIDLAAMKPNSRAHLILYTDGVKASDKTMAWETTNLLNMRKPLSTIVEIFGEKALKSEAGDNVGIILADLSSLLKTFKQGDETVQV